MDFINLKTTLTEILQEIRTLFDFQCVGIRLQNNEDFPYFVHEGFPSFFIKKENSLQTKDEQGLPFSDDSGNPILDCICGKVLDGKFDSSLSFFTTKGSFWTNSISDLLSSKKLNDWKDLKQIRGMCPNSGYESMGMIPIKVKGKTLGLIHLNDPRENMFTIKTIKKIEEIADHIGTFVNVYYEIQEKMKEFSE